MKRVMNGPKCFIRVVCECVLTCFAVTTCNHQLPVDLVRPTKHQVSVDTTLKMVQRNFWSTHCMSAALSK